MSRGLRNNNPGNIIKTKVKYVGEVDGTDSRFKTFISIDYGYRAMFMLLASYVLKGYNTIDKIIHRWAPPFENNSSNYVSIVASQTGIPKDKVLTINDSTEFVNIVAAISRVENGKAANMQDVKRGFELQSAFKKKALFGAS